MSGVTNRTVPFSIDVFKGEGLPKTWHDKVPEGYSLVNLDEVYEKIDALVDNAREEIVQGKSLYGFGGFIVGAALGGAAGYFITRRLLETKYIKIAEDDIDEMRQYYQDKKTALSNTAAKPELDEIVREKGYSTASEPPMAVTPPNAVVEAAEESNDEERTDPRPPVPVVREENIFRKPPVTEEEVGMPLVEDDWDYHKERANRSPLKPYVIHIDEKDEYELYDTVTYTYYEEDDVLCNERDEVIPKDERDMLIGEANLERFGHGSGDATVVYIRNDRLEMQMEICQSPNSYAEEVHGFEPTPPDELRHQHRRERRSLDDE